LYSSADIIYVNSAQLQQRAVLLYVIGLYIALRTYIRTRNSTSCFTDQARTACMRDVLVVID